MEDASVKASELKQSGNTAMSSGDFAAAIECYTEAIALSPDNHVLYSNRSAAHMKQESYQEALQDAEKTVEIKKDWGKGYSRKGSALFKLNRLGDAEETYKEGLRVDPENASLKEGLEEVKAKQRAEQPSFFSDPLAEFKLRSNPKTKAYMDDPAFVSMLKNLQLEPNNIGKYMRDPRIIEAMGVLMGVDLNVMKGGAEGDPFVLTKNKGPSSSDLTGEGSDEEGEPMDTGRGGKTTQGKDKAADEGLSSAERESKKEALEEKEKGNTAYKSRDFDTALAHYDRALELDPSNITFLTNKAAVYSEKQDWDKCIELCEEAVEKGREIRADYKLIAKALARIGGVYYKQEKWELAVKYFDKSLADHRNQDIVKKKREAEKKFQEMEKLAYLDVDKSLEEKETGNALFKDGDFPGAIKCYTEAIKRDPDNAKLYSNRAASYQKIMEFTLALQDCEECIRLNPEFVKGYIRKGNALIALKDTFKASQAFQAAQNLDPNNAEAREGITRSVRQDDPEDRRKAAMHDPEVQQILNDPAMQLILQQMQSQPEALRDHLKNPEIASKIQKLMEAGFISLR